MRNYVWTPERLAELEKMLLAGTTMAACAEHYGCSKANISLVRVRHLGHLSRRDIGKCAEVAKRIPRVRKNTDLSNMTPLELRRHKAFVAKRHVAEKTGVEFTIQFKDIVWPEKCPIFGTTLDYFVEGHRTAASPSFDRVDPSKGYVPGNVQIISWRANRIKNDGTAEEHLAIAHWMQKVLDNAAPT